MAETTTAPAKIITYEELKEHTKKDKLWVLLHNKVYDLTKFIDEHPGGDEVVLAEAGKDASEAFEDVGHSDEARALLSGMYVGDFEQGGVLKTKAVPQATSIGVERPEGPSYVTYLFPLAFLGLYMAWRFYS